MHIVFHFNLVFNRDADTGIAGSGLRGRAASGVGGTSATRDYDVATVRNGIKVDVAILDGNSNGLAALGSAGSGPIIVVLYTERKGILVFGNIIGNSMGQLDRNGTSACRSRCRASIAFLDVHGNMTHRSDPNVLVVLASIPETFFHSICIGRRVIRIAICSRCKAMGEERDPAALLNGRLHIALEIAGTITACHHRRDCSPVARAILTHNTRARITNSSDNIILQDLGIAGSIAVRVCKRYTTVGLLNILVDFSLG